MGATTQTIGSGDSFLPLGNRNGVLATVAMSSSYATNGDTVTAAKFGLVTIDEISILSQPAGYVLEFDKTNLKFKAYRTATLTPAGTVAAPTFTGTANVGTSGIVDDNDNAATVGHALYVVPDTGPGVYNVVLEGSAAGLIKDSDTAATEGVQIYVVIDDVEFLPGYQLGHLEFVSPTNAHGTCTIANGAQTLLIEDDDSAATNGVEVRAIAASGGLEATLAGTVGPCLVPLSDGNYLSIADSTNGATPAVYFDEDAANTYERLRAVVVDNLDEPYKVAESSHLVARPSFVAGTLAKLVTVGPGATTSTGTVGASGPTFTVSHDQAAAQMVGAALLYVQAAAAGFNAANGGERDLYIPTSTGELIKVAYAASPTGVQVYWDHDSANAHERMKAVVVDNLDEDVTTEAAVGWKRDTPAGTNSAPALTGTATTAAALAEVGNAVDLSAVTARVLAIGW
jgi:hypothetical protein